MNRIITTVISIILVCNLFSVKSIHAQVTQAEYEALEALYIATNGAAWTNNTNWDFTGTANDVTTAWHGITVVAGHVTRIVLDDNNLIGSIPTEIGDFPNLRILDLSINQLSGSIITEISLLTNLEWLRLNSNQLTGTIPNWLNLLTKLQVLHLDVNFLDGNVPANLGDITTLTDFQLAENNLTGSVPISITNLINLHTLTLRHNNFTFVPDLSPLSALNILRLQNNRLHFESLEDNHVAFVGLGGNFSYAPQAKVGVPESFDRYCGEQLVLSVSVGGTNNTYKWFKGGVEIPGANLTTYTINTFAAADAGTYHCEISNTVATALVLSSENKVVNYMGSTLANVITTPAAGITTNSATISGNVLSDGCAAVTDRGLWWGPEPNVIVTGTHLTLGSGTGNFFSGITGLSPNTTYYFRAFALNSVGFSYGEELSFTTLANLPTVTTSDATNIEAYAATLGGNATSGGGIGVSSKGVYYGTEVNPEVTGTLVNMGNGIGVFSGVVEGLVPGTVYYFKAFATNAQGTAFGLQKSFTTLPLVPEVFTDEAYDITHNSAVVGGYVGYNGGATVVSRGVYWGEEQNPSTTGEQFRMGQGDGNFSNTLSGLQPVTTYYVQAFATNSAGTAFGEQVEFTTLATIPDVETISASEVTTSTGRINGDVTFDGGTTIIERGFYWGLDPYPMEDGELVQLDPGIGAFSQFLDGLEPSTLYYFQAYAINSIGMAEGDILNFLTEVEDQIAFFPTAFNPNSSVEINRTFKPIFQFTPTDYSLEVYNRWGSKVFQSEDFNSGWNGYANGAASPIGPYSYKASYTDEKGESHVKIGVVNLVR